MDAITASIIANVERLVARQGCSEDCTSACRGWCQLPPPLFVTLTPQVANVEPEPLAVPVTDQRSPTVNVEADATRIPIVIYTPSQLFVDGAPGRFRKETTGTPGVTTWDGLVRLLSRAHEGDPKKYLDANVQKAARGGWSACALRGGRRLGSAFVETRLLGLDIDKNGDIDKALTAFEPFRKIVLSTYKSTAEKPRCRVILLLTEPCRDAALFRRAHEAVRHAAVSGGWFEADDFDKAGGDPERLWFLPMMPPGVAYVFHATDGALLDIRKLAPNVSSKKATIKTSAKPRKPNTNGSGALAFAERKMATASKGHRHTTAFSMAAWLSEIKPQIPEHEIEGVLMRYAPQRREDEFRRTIGDAIRRGRAA